MEKENKVAVIGGGSAGTMAMLRTVLNNDKCLFFPGSPKDKKKSRAFWVTKVENVPGHAHYKKGIDDPNKETLTWVQESEYKENLEIFKNKGIVSLKKVDGGFELIDNKEEKHFANYVILCTGVMDIQPTINGSIDAVFPYANTQHIDYCLRCDGHHTLGKKVSIIGHDSGAAWVGIMLKERYHCPSMTILTHGQTPEFNDEVKTLMDIYKINVIDKEITEVLGNPKPKEAQLDGFKFVDGSTHESNFAFVSLGMMVYNELAKNLGAELDKRGFVVTNEKGESSIENLYVAGDLRAKAKKQIYTAWDHAVDSADDINARIRRKHRAHLYGHLTES